MCGIFFILLRSWVINKSAKNDCVEITQDRNKIYKNPTHAFLDNGT